ncbi:nucleoside-diphosphate sugar epimerase [Actinotalea sp. K2]|uniref:nucleoside-diphosphate sugar epimerase n=1 Tax=Actinotalea sp. K2 TaxID=2939438 RepID=UPI0020178F47|nr:nucleoside-diphosphate sugar epimerase [Actinotalea sp. K2]MCL3859848.1 nucleoside-diphosphate sugar epimerase [Actinotalea sp. K2]
MTTTTVRSGRSDAGDAVVVVGRGPLAVAVVTRLAASSALGAVRSVPELPAVGAHEVLAGAAAVVLVADEADLSAQTSVTPDERRTAAVAQAQRTVEGARAAGVRQVVAVTSAMVHGASPGRAVITDDEPPPAGPGDGLVGDLVATEAVLARAARRRGPKSPTIMVLRPAAVVGPGVDTLVTRHFAAPRLLAVRGVERGWQLVHADDVASAVELALVERWSGSATVAAGPVLTLAQVELAAGMRRIELAAVTAFGTAERLQRVGVIPTPASELAFAVYPWTVEPARLTAAGWEPAHDADDCLAVLLEGVRGQTAVAGRRLGGRDAALGAAGAAVAVLGTAAAWRQARARRRG